MFAPAAIAAVAFSVALPAVASADWADDGSDLGISIKTVARTQDAVDHFLSSLKPDVLRAVLGGCQNYVAHPNGAHSIATVPFCQLALSSHIVKPTAAAYTQAPAASPASRAAPGAAIDWNKYY
jgi:hypothetical protein